MSILTTNFFENNAIFSQNPSSHNGATIFYTLTNRKARFSSNHPGNGNERFARTKMQSAALFTIPAFNLGLQRKHFRCIAPFNAYTGTQIATSAKQKKAKKESPEFALSRAIRGFFGGEQGIRTLEHPFRCYTISNRAPSASSDNSPYTAGARCVRLFTFNPRPGSKRRTDSAFPQTYPWTAASGWGWDNGR